ncbi:MAG: phosphonoacetaldehyde hydrolase [Clostridia bacterium]|nr:phosphonoacetaldehyde hydrolase [Clostridia bacterium]
MKTEAVIFDWAGTTVDYGCFAPVGAFIKAFEEFGITPTVDEVRAPMGMLKWNHINEMLKGERISAEWERIYGRRATNEDVDKVYDKSEKAILHIVSEYAEPKPYVIEVVSKLRERGIKIGSTTGYTDEMMNIVVPKAKEFGYSPDCWFSPNSVSNMGRPYPYMIFENLKRLEISSVENVIKIGDTISDIKEGKNAGVISVGVIEGSSLMAMSEEEFNSLSDNEKTEIRNAVREKFIAAGADYVIDDIRGVLDLVK